MALSIEQLAEHMSKSISSIGTEPVRGIFADNSASNYGLEPIGEQSCFALAVGVHPDLPEVVVKIMDKSDDACWDFIEAVHTGRLKGPLFPVIHSVTHMPNCIAVVIMERLLPFRHCNMMHGDQFTSLTSALSEFHFVQGSTDDQTNLRDWITEIDGWLDLHRGNVMFRANGDIVVIDPIKATGARRAAEEYPDVDDSDINEPMQCTGVPSDGFKGFQLGDFAQIQHGYGRSIHAVYGRDFLRDFNWDASGGDVGIDHGVDFDAAKPVAVKCVNHMVQAQHLGPNFVHAMDAQVLRRMDKLDKDAAHKARAAILKDFPWF